MISTLFSPCRKYRYVLRRDFEPDLFMPAERLLMVIGLNPSTADETNDDPTLRRCIAFAKSWGFAGLLMTNLFAYRATDPEVMKLHPEPVGQDNDRWLLECADSAGAVLSAWGTHGSHMGRADAVAWLLDRKTICLGKNADGSPKHPLYIAADTQPDFYP